MGPSKDKATSRPTATAGVFLAIAIAGAMVTVGAQQPPKEDTVRFRF